MGVCRLCNLSPREGDNLALVRVMPGHPHWPQVSAYESPGQTSVTVPVCFDCRRQFSVDYLGLPPEMLGERPAWPKSRECPLCYLPARQGEAMGVIRVLPEDPQWAAVAEEGQPSVAVAVCEDCRAEFLPVYAARVGMTVEAMGGGPKHLV